MKKHICLYKKMLAFALSFAMIAGIWGGIGINAKAENEGKAFKDGQEIKVGDEIREGDQIEFQLPNTITKIVVAFFDKDGEWCPDNISASYSGGKLQYTFPKLIGEKSKKEYSVSRVTGMYVAWDDASIWIFHVEVIENSGEIVPGGNTPGGNTPGENTPGGNTPGGNTPGENTPGENTPGGNTPGENTPGGNTSGENTPGENTPGENTPGGNTSGEELAENNPAKENSNVSSESTTSKTVNDVTRHTCNFEWVITVDPTTGADGLEEYRCTGCGAVSQSHPIAASVAVIKDFYGKVKEAPENGNITYDSGKLYTISDYLLKKMAERNDVSVTVKFEYKNRKYQLTFPAGLDYSTVLTDEETMYGYFGAAAKLALKVTEQ